MSAFNVILGCVMALLIILFTMSSIARYYIKFTIFVVLCLIFATAPVPLMLIKPFDPKNAFAVLILFVSTSQSAVDPRYSLYDNPHSYPTTNCLIPKCTYTAPRAYIFIEGRKKEISKKICCKAHDFVISTYSQCRPGARRIPSALLRLSARMLGIRWTVRGLENVDNSRGAVVLLNHQSGLDLYVLAVLWPLMSRCTVVSKRSLQYLVPFGTATWLWGTVFIDRGAQSARNALNKQAEAVREQKRKLLLFPEGTRNSGDRLLPFRKGAFHVAMDAGAPIQPVVVSKYHFLDADKHRFGSGEIIISILPMIETEGKAKDDIVSLVEKTQINMQEEFTRISAETLARRSMRAKNE